VSRPRWELRDAAVGYAARGIAVLPLHYPLPHRTGLQPVSGDPQAVVARANCSCRDPSCGQVGKHPLGTLVPHGVKDATCNRARILAWWTRHPSANIGLATGHRFDVLDVDGPTGAQAIRELATAHGLASGGPLVRTGGGGWHFYLAPTGLGNAHPTGLDHTDWRGRGGYVVAPPR
jgi:Bifunctional DNA primase/polymerase, N-terminal